MTDFDKIIWREGLTLVDFFATWCGPCQAMNPTIEQFKKQMNGRVDVYKIDIDDRQMVEIMSRYEINSVPTLMIFRHGNILWRQSGCISYENLVKILNQIELGQLV